MAEIDNVIKKLNNIRVTVTDKLNQLNKAQGQYDEVMNQIKVNYKVKTLKEAETKLIKIDKQLETDNAALAELLSLLEEAADGLED